MKRTNARFRHVALALPCWIGLAISGHGAGFEALAHHWNFDEGPDWHDDPFGSVATATVARDWVGEAHATLQGMGDSAWVSGRQYTGLMFDGVNDALQCATDLSPVLAGTASMSMWIRTSQTGAIDSLSAPGLAGSAGVQWGWLDDTGHLAFSVGGTVVARTADPVNDGAWHHVVLTRNAASGAVQIFVDSALSHSAMGPPGTLAGSINRIGHMQNGSPVRFQGRLDQVHLFHGEVDTSTVEALYDNHAPKTWVVTSDGEYATPFPTDSVLINTFAYDAEQDTLSVASFTQPAHGTVAHNGDGSFTYSATGAYIGTDAFTAVITDGRGGFTRSDVQVHVSAPPTTSAANRTTTFTEFQAVQAGGSAIGLSGWREPRALDWDQDGDQDLLIGHGGAIWRYANTGTPTAPAFAAGSRVQANGTTIALSGSVLIALADMTGDGVDDLIAVDSTRRIRIYRNQAAAGLQPTYAAAVFAPAMGGGNFVLPDQRFDAADWDGDGRVDLVMGHRSGELRAYRNVGTPSAPQFDLTDYEALESGSYNLFPRVYDINGNGILDYIRGINWGSINYWFDPGRAPGLGTLSGALTVSYADHSPVEMKPITDGAMVDFADLNGDGVLDLLVGGHAGSGVYLAYGVATTVADSIAEIETIYNAHPTALGAALEADNQALLNQVKAAEANILTHMAAATYTERVSQFALLSTHVQAYPFLQMGTPLDTVAYHHLPSIAGQNLMTLHEMLPDTPGHRIAVADAVGLTGLHRDIYLQMGLHVGDNQQGTLGQLESIRDFMALQPRESFPDAAITLNHYYGDQRGGWVSSFRGAKNTFNFGEGNNVSEWAGDLADASVAFFKSDVHRGDYFTFVMGHEVTHSLDGYVVNRANADLWRRKGQMLTYAAGPDVLSAAGDDNDFWDWNVTKARFLAQGYWDGNSATWDQAWDEYWTSGPGSAWRTTSFMRGNLNIDWFLGASQESLATQANHHWAHAEARLIGAIDRYQRGVRDGIDPMKANITEVLTFLDWISAGMNKVVMQDTTGVSSPYPHAAYDTTHAWLDRDDHGYITGVRVAGRSYEFAVDDHGIVTALLEAPAVSKDDAVTVIRDTMNLMQPLANDTATAGSPVVESHTLPAHGALHPDGEGTWIYTPHAGYTGPDSFTYALANSIGSATVRIQVRDPVSAQSGIRMDTWTGLGGNAISTLTSDPDYPFQPDQSVIRTQFNAPSNRGSSLGTRMHALLTPPTTGTYTFWIASDDDSQLWLSSDRSERNTTLMASVSGWTDPEQWDASPSQQSVAVPLQAGRPYFIEALHKEGSGGDHLAVAWQGPGMSRQVIAGSFLQTVSLAPPRVENPVGHRVVVENASPTSLDLAAVFSDPDPGDALTLAIHDNDRESLVTASLIGTQLTLAYAPDQIGVATITLRAADSGGALVLDAFTVTVEIDTDDDGDPDRTDPDDDNDGIPDAWELAHALDPLVQDATDNPDHDPHDNMSEYIGDTDPHDPESVLTCRISYTPGPDTPVIAFPTSANRHYAVEYQDSLTGGEWAILQPAFAGDGGNVEVQDPSAPPHRYYRVPVRLPSM